MSNSREVCSARLDADQPDDRYRPPQLRRLGTLAELTKGGVVGPDDGLGGAGDASF